MRLRNIPHAEGTIHNHWAVIRRPKAQKGCWEQVFCNKNPVHIEIGMGKGLFLLQLAAGHPKINYVGIERYPSVLLRALEKFDTDQFKALKNIRFVCMDASEISEVFSHSEVEKIYLNFSDPWPKARHAKRRLTSMEFLKRYEDVLIQGGNLEFKTDNTELFDFSIEQVEEAGWKLEGYTYDLHHHDLMNSGNVRTEYEEKFSAKGNLINKLIAIRK